MTAYPELPTETLQQLPPHAGSVRQRLEKALKGLNRKIVVLDDDPTGVQTVHDVYVYTRWDRETIRDAFRAPEQMFFILTNSRGLTAPESRAQHREIAENLAAVSAETGTDFILLSRGDSTLRGHWPMETEVLRETLEREIEEYNGGCAAGRDVFLKPESLLRPLEAGEYVCIRCGVDYILTHGGIRVDECMRVLRADGSVIPGLYAAGVDISGLDAAGYQVTMGGHSFGLSLTGGRWAAECALKDR